MDKTTTYDRTYEYRADHDGHEVAGFIVAASIGQAAAKLHDQCRVNDSYDVDVRLLIEVLRVPKS